MLPEKKLSAPQEWIEVKVPGVDANLYNGSQIYVTEHTIQVASRYPTYEDGELVDDLKQSDVAKFLNEYNKSNNCAFRYPTLFEDEAIRKLGKNHAIFDENFQRNGMPWKWGYVADFTLPYGNGEEGINQMLTTRKLFYRLPDGDAEIGVTTIAPSGMVPLLTREQIKKLIGADGLKKLGKLRGKEIYEKDNEIVDVRNALGYPQLTLYHNQKDENGIISHSYHIYTPNQNSNETVGVRYADWYHLGERRCFDVSLRADPGRSLSGRSFPLVRGDVAEAKIEKKILFLEKNEFQI
ncbi:hypothetical protein HYZ41_00205 [archaeon]|nr:hypothetical protein [archaeon]